jgi:selenocysteine-specific elongation factor
MIAAEIFRAGLAGTTLRHLSRLSALATPKILELLKTIPVLVTRTGVVIRKTELENLLSRIPSLLASHPTGLSHQKLLGAVRGTSVAVLDEALAQLQTRGVIIERGKQLLLPRPDEDRARATNEIERAAQIAQTLQHAGLTPPNPGEIVIDAQSKRAVDRLLREHVIVRAVDRAKGKELLFHRDAIEDAQRRLAPLLGRAPGLLVTEIAAALGISRKFCMPLLDHLDSIRFTRRVNERRIRVELKAAPGRAI